LKRGSSARSGFAFAFSPNCSALSPPSLLCPSALVLLSFSPPRLPWPRWFVPSLPDRGGARHSASPAWMGHACVCWEDPGRHHSLSRRWGVCALRSLSLLRVGAADFAVLPAVAGGVRASTPAPHTPLHSPGGYFVHFCEMFVGVAACTSLFRQFFVLVRSGKGKDHLGAYYFQSRSDPTVTYIASFGGARWENWRSDWVIAST
jgi:hypothetical protein